ncbi:MAG TPA: cysteine desulfurase [Pirellulales bacterium]|nr:cysteine desulfurase [Pirellulales bacterium]
MDEITPDLIARMASRIYNEAPQPNGHAEGEPHVDASADTGRIAGSSPAAHYGSIPVAVKSWPHVPTTPPVTPPSVTPPMFSAPPTDFVLPGMTPPTTLPTAPHSPSEPLSVPGAAVAPPTSGITSEASPSGLSTFVASVRGAHLDRDAGLDVLGHSFRERAMAAAVSPGGSSRPFDVAAIRKDFPILQQRVHGKPIAWFDNAATTQKPQEVIDAVSRFYEQDNSNIHRGAHTLAARATDAYEKAREKVQTFLGASSVKDIVFVRGTTEGINLITQTYGRKFLQPGDEIVMSVLEHHANIVPWQMVAKEKGAVLRVIPVNDRGEVMLEEYQRLLGPKTKVVALTHASNSLGTILPVAEMTQMAKRYGARVLIDGAQSVAHIPVNVQQLGADFFVFSGHKIFGPTGIGAVYISQELQDVLPPWQGGGNMIRNVTFEETSYAEAPARFEAGTPNIADAVGLGAALDYVNRLGLPNIANYEHSLLEYATECLSTVNGLRLIGTAREKVGVLSFVMPNRRTEDIGRFLDQEGIAVRAGHHCSQPSLRRFGVETTVRPSLSIYNTTGEIDRLVDALKRIERLPG